MTIDARDFGRLEGKLDFLIDLVRQHVEDDKETHVAQDKRIAVLEADNNQSKGKASVIGGIAGSILGALAGFFSSLLRSSQTAL